MMNYLFKVIIFLSSFPLAFHATANATDKSSAAETLKKAAIDKAKSEADEKSKSELSKLGFGPALYLIKYDDEVLKDSKDIALRGDGKISTSGSDYSVTLGLELHFDFSVSRTITCNIGCEDRSNWSLTSSHRLSPFIGLFDVENGINGIAVGIIYGYTRYSDTSKTESSKDNKVTLNFGVGKIIHKDRLVLSSDLKEGSIPPTELKTEDYAERKDTEGITFIISANFGF